MRKFFLFFFCLTAWSVSARMVVTGYTSDKQDGKPVEGALVELVRLPDSSFVESTQTNTDGLFMLNKADTSGSYCLRVKHLLYKTTYQPVPRYSGRMINNAGNLSLEPNTYNLSEIVVKGVKVTVTQLGDRTVYGVPEGIQKTSTDGVDVLRKIPQVQVDYLNEDITVNGKSNIRIEVDGISRDKGYLKRLHPSQISKLEVITSPSGKYDAEIDAVINVVTNPAMRYGLKGMLYGGVFAIGKESFLGMANASVDYGLEKISYYVSANAIRQDITAESDMSRRNRLNSDYVLQRGTQQVGATLANFNAGFIWDPDKYNDISFNLAYNNTAIQVGNDNFTKSFTGPLSNRYSTTSDMDQQTGGLTSSLYYKHWFDKEAGHQLETEWTYYNSLGNHTTTDYQNRYYDDYDSLLYEMPWRRELSDATVRTFSGQVNYNLPFDSVYFFNAGVNGNYNYYFTDNESELYSATDLDYTDLRLGGYLELSRSIGKGNLKLGSRFETSRVVFAGSSPSHYFSILPYANGFFRINDDNSIKLAYSRRVLRPSSTQLNPMVSIVDSLTISSGNPNLSPAYRDNFQLTYNWRWSLKNNIVFNISPEVFYEYKTGLIQTVLSQNSTTGLFESAPVNVSDGYEYGGALSLNSQLGQVMINSNLRYSRYHVDAYLDQILARNRGGWDWNTFAMSPLPWNMHCMGMLNLSGPVLDGQTEMRNSAMYILGLGKQFKNNGVLRLMAYNPFSKYFFQNTSTLYSPAVYQVEHTKLPKQYGFMLMYVYQFKIGKDVKERTKRNVDAESTQNSLLNLPMSF